METPPPEEKQKVPDELQFGSAMKKLIELDLEISNANQSHDIKLPTPESSPGSTDKPTETFQELVSKIQHGLDLQAESVARAHKQIIILKEGLPARFKECLDSAMDAESAEYEVMQADTMISCVAHVVSRVTKTSEDLPRAKEQLGYVKNASKEVPEDWTKLMENFDNVLKTVDTLKKDMALVMSQLISGKTELAALVKKFSPGDAKETISTKDDEQKTLSTPDDKTSSKTDEKTSSSPGGKKDSPPTPEDSKTPLVANLTKDNKA